jgi:hypothetical protein
MKRVQEAKKRAGAPASKGKSRIVAVEEHFVTETYFDEIASLRVPARASGRYRRGVASTISFGRSAV